MPRVAPDNNDVIVWLLNESATPFVNSSTSPNSLGSAANLTVQVGTVETGQESLFQQSCTYFPAFGNFPSGASATHNRLETAGGAAQDLAPPISVSAWVKVRSWNNLGDGFGFMIMKRYKNDTSWASPFVVMDFTMWNSVDGTWRTGVTCAKQYGNTGTITAGGQAVLTDLNANFTGTIFRVNPGDVFVVQSGANAGTYSVSSATTTTITMTGNFSAPQTNVPWSIAPTYQDQLLSATDYPMPLPSWTHIGWTFDGYRLVGYLNGMVAGVLIMSPQGVIDNSNHGPWAIGATPEGDGNKQEGAYSICDVRIANTVRPRQYFENIYRQGVLAF